MEFFAVGDGVGDHSSSVYRFSYHDGIADVAELGESGVILWDLALDNSLGMSLYAISDSGALYRVDGSTGSLTYIGQPGNDINALESCGGTLYGWGLSKLVTISPATGQILTSRSVPYASSGDLMCAPSGALYGIATSSGNDILVLFNANGTTTSTGITLPGIGFYAGIVDGEGNLYVSRNVAGQLQLYHVDLASHIVTLVGTQPSSLGMNGLAVNPLAW